MKIPFSGNVGEFYTVLNRAVNGGTGGQGCEKTGKTFQLTEGQVYMGRLMELC